MADFPVTIFVFLASKCFVRKVFESIFKHFYLFASNMLIAFEFEKFIPKPNTVITSLLKKLLDRKPFKKRLERKPLPNLKHHDDVITSLFNPNLTEK
jgi:hypothetical protein